MANNVKAQVIGGQVHSLDGVCNVGDVKRRLDCVGYTATVNGEPEGDDYSLSDFEFVSLAPAVKGGI